jgi:hypothetical protein
LIFELAILTIPKDFHETALVSVLLIVLGLIIYFALIKKRIEKVHAERETGDIINNP